MSINLVHRVNLQLSRWSKLTISICKRYSHRDCQDIRLDFNQCANDYRKIFGQRGTLNLVKTYGLLTLCSFPTFVNNAFQIFQVCQTLFGRRLFEAVFKPFVYKQYIAGDTREDILGTLKDFEARGWAPFLSPMLEIEEDEDAQVSEIKRQEIYKRNSKLIHECIDVINEGVTDSPKTLAIKLTAILPASVLHKIARHIDHHHKGEIIASDIKDFDKSLQSAEYIDLISICAKCVASNIDLYIDAEFSELQSGVRFIVLSLMHRYRKHIFNTYQCYLKRTYKNIVNDLRVGQQLKFGLACKLVRGAYLQREMALCNKNPGRVNPIHESYSATNDSFNAAVDLLLATIADEKRHQEGSTTVVPRVTIATHNYESIVRAVEWLTLNGIPDVIDEVAFAQINSMGDQMSHALVHQGYTVLKLVPCGSVNDVLPWLARRMQENGSVIERLEWDRSLLRKALKERVFGDS